MLEPRPAYSLGGLGGRRRRLPLVLAEAGVGAPLLQTPMTDRVLVQCAWLRPGSRWRRSWMALETLAAEHSDQLRDLHSYVLMANGDLRSTSAPRWAGPERRCRSQPSAERAHRRAPRAAPGHAVAARACAISIALIGPEVARRSTLDRAAAARLAAVFVPTRAYRRALRRCAEHRFAVLTGPPEMGKTAVARMVAPGPDDRRLGGPRVHQPRRALARPVTRGRPRCSSPMTRSARPSTAPDSAERWARAMERLLRASTIATG